MKRRFRHDSGQDLALNGVHVGTQQGKDCDGAVDPCPGDDRRFVAMISEPSGCIQNFPAAGRIDLITFRMSTENFFYSG